MELVNDFRDLWSDTFSWLVYPVRVPVAAATAVLLLYVVARWVLPALKALPPWLLDRLGRFLGSVLLLPEYGVTRLLIRNGTGIPVALRVYGDWVENVTDWVGDLGRLLGRGAAKASGVPFVAAAIVVVVYLFGYNMHVVGAADGPGTDAPVVTWWDALDVWWHLPDPDLLEDRHKPGLAGV
ncbi:hypothetical protein [Streptomyces phaeochromogenes]|uniref:hypothetical protein n=1 Tax=Streptomyces phaeochromogenes TaxID=1923 RepID=UPI0036BFDA36